VPRYGYGPDATADLDNVFFEQETKMTGDRFPSRRRILANGAFAATNLVLASGGALAEPGIAPTPTCQAGVKPTVPEGEGPFFKPHSPERSNLREPGLPGRPIELSGRVLTRSCRPVSGALFELWHADDKGDYDTKGFRLRGHLFTDADGRYAFRTIVPAVYPGRTRHFHVKIQGVAHGPVLTTQFYFPGEPRNRKDFLFRPDLLMNVSKADDGLLARFDVVLRLT
jgi:protocatechuate 3,4-dioxygenase beta subunit